MAVWAVPGYTGLRALGSGGFGDVVLARHDATGTLVAIKYLRGELISDPEFTQMFRIEAAMLAALADPNIVRLYEYVETPAGAAIVMELVDGVTLRQILARQGNTTAEAALVVLQGSLLGLAAAHRRGVVHRDYKPENVLIDGAGGSKLTDFGIAARTGDRPVPAGTLAYVAPEQIAGAPASPAGDVYAATATFYECLTGAQPFAGESQQLLYQHQYAPVPLDPVPDPLRPLVAAGMAKDPAWRPADAITLVRQLQAIAAPAYGPDWARRGRSHLGEAALLLAALWPSATAPATQATAVQRISLLRRAGARVSPVRAFIAAGVVVAVAAGGVVVANAVSHTHHHHAAAPPPPAPSPSASPSGGTPSPSPSPSPSGPTPSPSASASSPGTVPPGYSTYTNPRFGFTTIWPSSLTPLTAPTNGDGQEWISADGLVTLSVFGQNNVLNLSPRQDLSADSRGLSVTYPVITGNVVTVSGHKDGGRVIVYRRDVVGPGSIDTLYWTYPTSQKALWNAAVTMTAHAFQPGSVATAH